MAKIPLNIFKNLMLELEAEEASSLRVVWEGATSGVEELAQGALGSLGTARWRGVMDLRLDLRVGVLTDVKNNGTRETWGFRQVRASLRIKTICPVCIGVLWLLGFETLSTPPFIV
jgi:hypothetical protein